MTFEIFYPEGLAFADYLAVIQVARTWADAQDRKDSERFMAAVAPKITVDYSLLMPEWKSKEYSAQEFTTTWLSPERVGLKIMATQHLLGMPYIKSASPELIVAEFQEIASHGRREAGAAGPFGGKIEGTADGKGWAELHYVKVDGKWRISLLKPSIVFMAGDFERIRRPEGTE